MNEDDLVSRWLNAMLISDVTLAGLTPGGIFEGGAGDATPTPYVYYGMASAVDLMVVGAIRVWTNMLWDVTAVAQTTDPRVMRPISDRIDDLLHRASGSTVEGVILSATRQAMIRRGPERAENGKLYLYRTQEFRVMAQKAA